MDLVGKYILADNVGGGEGGAALLDTYYGALMDRLVRHGARKRARKNSTTILPHRVNNRFHWHSLSQRVRLWLVLA